MLKVILLIIGLTLAQCNFENYFSQQSIDEDPIQALQDLMNGLWEQANLTDPTGLAAACFNETSAQLFLNTVNASLQDLAVNNVVGALRTAHQFLLDAPETNTCMASQPQPHELFDAYGLSNYTYAQISAKIGGYIITHLSTAHQEVVNASSDFQSGNYVQTGKDGGLFLLEVFGNNWVKDIVALQQ